MQSTVLSDCGHWLSDDLPRMIVSGFDGLATVLSSFSVMRDRRETVGPPSSGIIGSLSTT
jgi:hypothetical protein